MSVFFKTVLAVQLLAVAVLPSASVADMYIWKDPETGRTRMSNIPPAWLRNNSPGPKVEVVRDNKVIDVNTSFGKPQPPAALSARQRAAAGLPEQDEPVAPPVPAVAPKPDDEDDP